MYGNNVKKINMFVDEIVLCGATGIKLYKLDYVM